ncbi:hypothetical protein L1887_04626 [Cichorium endivia]|nr:hypothetical protein L1887_04626 [Cichorium endivia]
MECPTAAFAHSNDLHPLHAGTVESVVISPSSDHPSVDSNRVYDDNTAQARVRFMCNFGGKITTKMVTEREEKGWDRGYLEIIYEAVIIAVRKGNQVVGKTSGWTTTAG